jgi:serine/threonine protein kinase
MKKGDVINRYRILRDFTTAGGGLSKWTFAEKGGKEFFFKEFLAPTYPTDDAPGSPKIKERKRARCAAFEAHQKRLIDAVKSKCAPGGNVVFAHAFFRSGAKYYKVTDKVEVASLGVEDIARLPLHSRILIMKTAAHSLGVLHKLNIVHGDLKPNNLLIKRSALGDDTYIAKLIDFDNSYFSGNPPEVADDLVGDLVFYSPEAVRYVRGDDSVAQSDLSLSSDIFALGVIYCLYLTGELPVFKDKFQYPCISAINGEHVRIHPEGVPYPLAEVVNDMLQTEAVSRPNVGQVLQRLKDLDKLPMTEDSGISGGAAGGGLRGSLLRKSSTPTMRGAATETPPTPTTPTGGKLRGKLIKRD